MSAAHRFFELSKRVLSAWYTVAMPSVVCTAFACKVVSVRRHETCYVYPSAVSMSSTQYGVPSELVRVVRLFADINLG